MTDRFRVLVAEDEPVFGRAVVRFLQDRGHEVKLCPTAEAARKALASGDWDVFLLDLKLPDADGVTVLSEVRESHPDLQTIIVTGFANVDSAIATMRLGYTQLKEGYNLQYSIEAESKPFKVRIKEVQREA